MRGSAGRPQVILGAGCAGLSLAVALVRRGVRSPIVVVDRRTEFGRDRTWCFWDADVPFAELASHRWSAWTVRTRTGAATGRSHRHPYVHLDSRDFYRAALEELAGHRNVELRLGETVLGLHEDPDGLTVRTSAGAIDAERAFDGLAGASPLLRGRPDGEVELAQRFRGQVVRVDRPAFDPNLATLMDFRVEQGGELRFVYVLPFSTTEALVEDTRIGARPSAPGTEALADYLDRHHGVGRFEVEHSEWGRIPMTTFDFPVHRGPRIHAIGLAAGAARPSSGYAFARTVRHTRALARALAEERALPARLAPRRRTALDTIFLRAMAADASAFPEHFRSLVARTSGPAFARFMTDAAGPLDELRVMAALPPRPFVRAAVALPRAPERARPVLRPAP